MKKTYPAVAVGQIWRDLDPRMWSGNRRVVVVKIQDDGFNRSTVLYQQVVGANNRVDDHRKPFRSRYERFQRAFELVTVGDVQEAR